MITIVVDYSKFHDVRVDHQLATRSLVPDVVQLQTLHDFTRWKRAGVLQPYKPAGFSKLYKDFADPDGAWVSVGVIAFSYLYNVAAVGGNAPRSPLDLIDPRWKGVIASAYPHDDDAVLYLYYLYAKTYGREFMVRLAELNPQFARGTHTPPLAVGSGQKAIGIGTAGTLTAPATAPVRWESRTATRSWPGASVPRSSPVPPTPRRRRSSPQLAALPGGSAERVERLVGPHGRDARGRSQADLAVPQRQSRRVPALHGRPCGGRAVEADVRALLR